MDAIVDLLIIGVATLLSVAGVLVSIKPPSARVRRHWYVGLFLIGMVTIILAAWQQYRSREARNADAIATKASNRQLQEQVTSLRAAQDTEVKRREIAEKRIQDQATEFSLAQKMEIVRRQQAERDLQVFINNVGLSTRNGVMADIKKSPIRVLLNGVPTRDPTQVTKVREALGDYLQAGATLRNRCRIEPLGSHLEIDAEQWFSEVQHYLEKNLDRSFRSQFVVERASAFIPDGIAQQRVALWNGIDQRIETLGKFIDQLK